MFQFFKQLFASGDKVAPSAMHPGQRVYAVGDIHGRLDLLESMIEAIEADDSSAGPAATTVILLGDLVDRGPESAGVLDRAQRWQGERDVRILAGNHEEMFLRSFDELDVLRHFLRHGGRETILSYGVTREEFMAASLEETQALMRRAVPAGHVTFMQAFEDSIAMGDYLFVHAGIAPGVPMAEQDRRDLRWIREPFLSHSESHGFVVVHGHTIRDRPEDRGNRIGIDTGAYRSGRLTALVLEDTERRYLEVTEG